MEPKPNCGIAHILGILLEHLRISDIFRSKIYLQSVPFELGKYKILKTGVRDS